MDAGPEKDAGIFGLDSGQLRTECEEVTPVPFIGEETAIRDGTLGLGLHDIVPDSSGGPIRVRYIRPARFAPQGEWGSCDGVTGTFNIAGMPGTRRYDQLQAQFEMKLTPCDGSDLEPQTVQGTFNVVLRRSLDTVCPP